MKEIAAKALNWRGGAIRPGVVEAADRFRFLNHSDHLPKGTGWSDCSKSPLWLYNLHYFDDLNAEGAENRTEWHRALIDRWVRENPPFEGIGWDAYPTSLRIVNWIKWAARGNELEPVWLESLALQARWLRRRPEYHLLANHLFVNAKALVFAGVFFEGDEAAEWRDKGLAILQKEMPEQILGDGGHFERSLMYHSIVLEDVLDLVNLLEGVRKQGEGGGLQEDVARKARSYSASMLGFLRDMCHPDGEISFFNDAAFGIAAKPQALVEYAERLGVEVPPAPGDGLSHFAGSGYIRYQAGPLVALLDVAPVGPDYQPGHAHADTLSLELSLFGQRVFVNSGTSTYEVGAERHRQRGTLAHNTVAIDGENSSEVWKSFRVARRAFPRERRIEERDGAVVVSCAHDGYRRLKGRPVHRREWVFEAGSLKVVDEIEARGAFWGGQSRARRAPAIFASFHLHPDVAVATGQKSRSIELRFGDGHSARFECEGGELSVEDSTWHPEFGMSVPNKVIRWRFEGARLECRLRWPYA